MPWITPTLRSVRTMVRDMVHSALPGSDALVPDSVLRVISDTQANLAQLTLQYIDWLALQLLPDSAETEWLDRHGTIWLSNADGTRGRKSLTYASGTIRLTGQTTTVVPIGVQFFGATNGIAYETIEQVTIGTIGTTVKVRALDPGSIGNLEPDEIVGLQTAIAGIDQNALVIQIEDGSDPETDDELRSRVLERIQQPPMGGCKTDYEAWARQVANVTRAWCFPLEMGIGTVTLRFMMDDVRDWGIPTVEDVLKVADWLDVKRPVAVKDFFCVAPIPYPLSFTISQLSDDAVSTRENIEIALKQLLLDRGEPGGTIYRSWVDEVISGVLGEDHHELQFNTTTMPGPGYIPVLGAVIMPRDRHVRRSGDDYTNGFVDLLPKGPAWPRENDSVLMRCVRGLANVFGFVDGRAADLLEIESDPRTTLDLLLDWERNWGLPDSCFAEAHTIDRRRQVLVMKMTLLGNQSRAFFYWVAEWLGVSIRIREYAPFMCGVSQVGDTTQMIHWNGTPGDHPEAIDPRWEIGPPENRFYWTINPYLAAINWFRATSGELGVDHHLEIGLGTDIFCLFERWKPAHTDIIMDYSNLGTASWNTGTP